MRRPLILLPLVLASALALSACGAQTPADPSADPASDDICATPSGDATSAVTVTGDFGTAPTIDFTAPLELDDTQRDVLVEGDEVAPGAQVGIAYALYNGTTGDEVETYGWGDGEDPAPFRADTGVLQEGFVKTLACLGPGSRVVGVIPPAEGFGAANPGVGIGEDDSLVFVVDVVADLSPVEWTTDVPQIGGTDEAPTVTLPATAPKTDLELVVLKEGDGDVVGAADSVTVNYLGTAWETGEIFDESYSKAPATFSVQGVVQGFSDALIGQKVGSRVLVTMPPALGYGGTPGHALEKFTLVFLIDIVDTGSAG